EVSGGSLEEVAHLAGGRTHNGRSAGAVGAERGSPDRDAGSGGGADRAARDTQHLDHVEIGDRSLVTEVIDDIARAKVQQHGRRERVVQVGAPGARINVSASRLRDLVRETFGEGKPTWSVLHLRAGR